MFFQGGVRIHKPANKPSSFNAFISNKSHEARAAGKPMTLGRIQEEFTDEYKALTPEEHQDLVTTFKKNRDLDTREWLKHPSIQEKVADAVSSFNQIAGILKGLKLHVGVDAVVLAYLPTIIRGWNTATIGKKVEALAVAGCNPTKLIQNLAEQVDALKKELAQLIQEALDKACTTTNQAMHYKRFDKLITLRYSIVCEGWPKELPFQKPSSFGRNNESLFLLHDAWQDGVAVFRKLDDEEFEAWKAAHAGKKRGPKGKGKAKDTGGVDEDSEEEVDGGESAGEGPAETCTPPSAPSVAKNKPTKPARKKKASAPKPNATTRVPSNTPNSALPVELTLGSPPDSPRPKPQHKPSAHKQALNAAQSQSSEAHPNAETSGSALEELGDRSDPGDSNHTVIDPQLLGPDPADESPSGTITPKDPAPPSDSSPTAIQGPESTTTIPSRLGKKHKEPVVQDDTVVEEGRSKQPHVPTKKRHLGASTHPATRTLGDGEDSS
ncbi:hypothetical protein PM082_015152 [Marasmius tenuissimus]|nr:hypothetical protein PM082_015152 [Marasmius tenuissimus]